MRDDIIYVILLLASIIYGQLTRSIQGASTRKWVSSVGGLLVVVAVSGLHTLHTIFAVAMQIVLLKTVPNNRVHLISFVAGFFHLFFFRLCGSGQDWPWSHLEAPPAHTNAIQMIMTLKLMGLAFEVYDAKSTSQISPIDVFHYAFCHAGILTGPYYKFQTFKDMHEKDFASRIDCFKAMLHRIKPVPIYVALYFLSGFLFPLDAVKEEGFYDTTTLLYRLFYMTPVFFNFRMRLYSGFVLSECSCIMAGLGAYPEKSEPKPGQGPSNTFHLEAELSDNEEMNFETVHNIDECGAETVPTMREALKTWNMTVQWWLASNVYHRFPRTISKGLRTAIVMAVSSAWHGVYAGYYLSLGSVPLVLIVEDLYERILRRRLSDKRWYDALSWFMRFQWFSYLGMGFQLLRVDLTHAFWKSVLYAGHATLAVFYLCGICAVNPLAKKFLVKTHES